MFINFKMIYQLGYAASNEKLQHYYSYRLKSLRPIPLSHSDSYMEGLWTSIQAEAENTILISTEWAKNTLCTCARKVLHFWMWESPIYKTFWVASVTCVTLHVGVTSSTYSNISSINSLWLSPLHPTSDGCAGTFDFLCTFYTRMKNTDLYSAVLHTVSTDTWTVL
jgi:hypothetical protein